MKATPVSGALGAEVEGIDLNDLSKDEETGRMFPVYMGEGFEKSRKVFCWCQPTNA